MACSRARSPSVEGSGKAATAGAYCYALFQESLTLSVMMELTKALNAPPTCPLFLPILQLIIISNMWQLRKSLKNTPRLLSSMRRTYATTESSGPPPNSNPNVIGDAQVNCLMLHPITWPNHGPHIELYLAEEAIGLVRSLDWEVSKGPLWKTDEEIAAESKRNQQTYLDIEGEEQTEQLTTEDADTLLQKRQTYAQRRAGMTFSHQNNMRLFQRDKIQDGDYVYAPDMQGVYFKKGGIIMEFDNDDIDGEYDMYDEWKNELLRESVAKASLIRVRKVHSSTYFTKGKLNELGYFLKENDKINVVFVNATLTAMQQKKLEKRWNDIILSREEKLRRYYLKSAQKEKFNPTDVDSESSQMSELETQHQQSGGTNPRKIRVVDRFGIILQIFAARAKTRAAQLQLELAWLKYARTMLVRGGAPTFGQLGSIFQGNMMRAEMVEVGIKSAKGRKSGSGGTIGGEGETQLEMERRKLTDRESKITDELSNLLVRKAHESKKRDQAHQTMPLIALIGYTNAGKTALINLTTGSHLESKDLLFQTLNTTHKRFRLPNGQMALMLDTVGFITNLPHGLVESFKTTLDEIHNAELLVHVRDISHPQTNYQRDTVIKVLKEIGVPDEVFENKYLEVWNKIDLLEDSGEFLQSVKQDMEATQQSYPVIMMSCKNGTNKEQFLGQIQNLTAELMGKETVELEYEYHMHGKVTKWLNEHANLTSMEDFQYTDDGKIILKVPIDEVTHQKYLKHFEEKKFQQGQEEQGFTRGRGMKPPPGWSNQ